MLPAITLNEVQAQIAFYDGRIKTTLRNNSPVSERARADLTLLRNGWQQLFDELVERRQH